MKEILREIGMIARALDSISNIEFKEYELTKGQYLYLVRICESPGRKHRKPDSRRTNYSFGKLIKLYPAF